MAPAARSDNLAGDEQIVKIAMKAHLDSAQLNVGVIYGRPRDQNRGLHFIDQLPYLRSIVMSTDSLMFLVSKRRQSILRIAK
jgi:hypothetical protein